MNGGKLLQNLCEQRSIQAGTPIRADMGKMVGVCDAQNPASIMLQCGKLGLDLKEWL